MSVKLSGKTIVITGASSGIGRATAIACARKGMNVVVNARREDKLIALTDQIKESGGQAVYLAGDVREEASQAKLMELANDRFGGIDAVFANAGYGIEAPGADMPEKMLRDIFEVNFFGTMNTIRTALPYLRNTGGGHILICSSCVSRIPLPFFGAYSATKAAQHHLGRAMRLELENENIYVSTIHPVGTRTEFFNVADQLTKKGGWGGLRHSSPDWATQSPEKVSAAVVRCLHKPRPEVWMSRIVQFGAAVLTMSPGLADFMLRRELNKRRKL